MSDKAKAPIDAPDAIGNHNFFGDIDRPELLTFCFGHDDVGRRRRLALY